MGRAGIWLSLAGAVCGALVTVWLIQIFIPEWLLVVFVVLAVLSEELQGTATERRLLDAMLFFDHLLAQTCFGQGLFEALAKALQELPAGELHQGVREAILRRGSGEDCARSLAALRGIDPLLDEFVLTLQLDRLAAGDGSQHPAQPAAAARRAALGPRQPVPVGEKPLPAHRALRAGCAHRRAVGDPD